MVEKPQVAQDAFLTVLSTQKTPVTIYLTSGVQLKGIVTWSDKTALLLRRDAHVQLVYKHAISTIVPTTPIEKFERPMKATSESDLDSGDWDSVD